MVKVKQPSVRKGNPKRLIGCCPVTDWFRLECGFLYDKELTAGAGAGSMGHNFCACRHRQRCRRRGQIQGDLEGGKREEGGRREMEGAGSMT